MNTVTAHPDGTGTVTIDGTEHTVKAADLAAARQELLGIVARHAERSGAPIHVVAHEDRASWPLIVEPDGTVRPGPDVAEPAPPIRAVPEPSPDTAPEPAPRLDPVSHAPEQTVADEAATREIPTRRTDAAEPHRVEASPPSRADAHPSRGASGSFVRHPAPAPQMGARALLYKVTGGRINLGPAAVERYVDELHARTRARLAGTHNITVMCLKGGIGKTTSALGLGLTLAECRADQVIALDMNPDAGDLADRALGHDQVEAISPRTITDVLRAIHADTINDLTELNRYTQSAERLHLIAGEQAPEVSESLTTEDYLAIRDVVDRFYPLTITDCGTGVTHPAMRGILERTDQIVVASGWAVSGAKRAQRTLEWLSAQKPYRALATGAVVVLTENARVPRDIDRQEIASTLGSLCKAVHLIPFDEALSRGDVVHTAELSRATRQAYLELAATVVDFLADRGGQSATR
jgi:MinD-like ATPase involved in chromosome partitioning or flagellar assembly